MDFSGLASSLQNSLSSGGDRGAGISIWRKGEEVCSLAAGFRDRSRSKLWEPDTLCLCWSATKGVAAATALHAMERHGIQPATSVASIWPEFAQHGKELITFEDVFAHRAGLSALDDATDLDPLDHAAVAAALAGQKRDGFCLPQPAGTPPTHGYHPRTFGYLLDEIVRRIEGGRPLGRYWRDEIAGPAEIDFWIGLPDSEEARMAETLAPRSATPPAAEVRFYQSLGDRESLAARSFASPGGIIRPLMMNTPAMRRACLPAFGGIGSASGLGKFYSILAAGGWLRGKRIFSEELVHCLQKPKVSGPDAVLGIPTTFSCGMMIFSAESTASHGTEAFGHPGAGGCLGFATLQGGVSFAYVPNQMELGILPTRRTTEYVRLALAGVGFLGR